MILAWRHTEHKDLLLVVCLWPSLASPESNPLAPIAHCAQTVFRRLCTHLAYSEGLWVWSRAPPLKSRSQSSVKEQKYTLVYCQAPVHSYFNIKVFTNFPCSKCNLLAIFTPHKSWNTAGLPTWPSTHIYDPVPSMALTDKCENINAPPRMASPPRGVASHSRCSRHTYKPIMRLKVSRHWKQYLISTWARSCTRLRTEGEKKNRNNLMWLL